MVSINIHGIEYITIEGPKQLDKGVFVLNVFIQSKDGESTEIALFSNKKKLLNIVKTNVKEEGIRVGKI